MSVFPTGLPRCALCAVAALQFGCSRGHFGHGDDSDQDGAVRVEPSRPQQIDDEPECVPFAVPDACSSQHSFRQCNAAGDGYDEVACPPEAPLCIGAGECVQCTVSICQDEGSLRECSAGFYTPRACAANETCIADGRGSAHCGGVCRAGRQRCNDTTKNAESCLDNGSWQQVDVCNVPVDICRARPQGAVCEANESYDIGGYIDSAALPTAFHPLRGKLYLQSFVPARTATVQALRAHGNQAQATSDCRMVLFSSTPEGIPLRKIAEGTDSVGLLDVPSGQATNLQPTLMAGATYWVGCKCADTAGMPVPLQQRVAPEQAYYVVDHLFGDRFPPNLPLGERQTGSAFSFFVLVRDVP